MASNLVISVRNVRTKNGKKVFGTEPGPTSYLDVPDHATPDPVAHKIQRKAWLNEVMARATVGTNPVTGAAIGDVLVFVHGYNKGSTSSCSAMTSCKNVSPRPATRAL